MWEYYIYKEPESGELGQALEDLGKRGWELVCVYQDLLIFKRPVKC